MICKVWIFVLLKGALSDWKKIKQILDKTSSLMFCIAVMDIQWEFDVDCRLLSRLTVCISQTTKQKVKLLVTFSGSDNKIEYWRRKTQIFSTSPYPNCWSTFWQWIVKLLVVVVELITIQCRGIQFNYNYRVMRETRRVTL